MIWVIILIAVISLITKPVLAIGSPAQVSPSNNSMVATSTLTWQPVEGSIQYRVIIDDESTVSSPYFKDPYYTTNTKYSPKLSPGKYYWKVAAKDSGGTWSGSSIWSFTLDTSIPTLSPTTSDPTLPSTTSTISTSSFTISNTPSQINSDQVFTIVVNLSLPNNPNTIFYLKGAFKKADLSNYFGKTKVSGAWVKNGSKFSEQYQITTDSSGSWEGSLDVQPDPDDSGLSGSGEYIFKVGRYSSAGSGPNWSNEVTINITGSIDSDNQSNSEDSKAGKSSSVLSTSSVKQSGSSTKPYYDTLVNHSASVAAASASASPSPSPPTYTLGNIQSKLLTIVGGILIVVGIFSLIFIYLRSRKIG